jgi:hypothetical protein
MRMTMNNENAHITYNAVVRGPSWTQIESSWPPAWLNTEPSPALVEVLDSPAVDEKCDVAAVVPAIETPDVLPLTSRFTDDALDDWPEPCHCGSFAFWWNAFGEMHCQTCKPPTKAMRLLRHAEGVRRRAARPHEQRA